MMPGHGAVLVVEDEYLLGMVLAEFVDTAGYLVVGPVASARRAQELINEKGIDAALLDVRLSDDEKSFELAGRLQAMRVPFAFVTAYSPTLFPTSFANIPFLIKPPTREGVVDLLSRLLPPPSAA
jgi:DNA-binding NtrC family response regulator